MIPVLLLAGLLAGRWYVVALASVVWPAVLVLDGIASSPASLLGAAALAAANTAAGVAVHKAFVSVVRQATGTATGYRRRRSA